MESYSFSFIRLSSDCIDDDTSGCTRIVGSVINIPPRKIYNPDDSVPLLPNYTGRLLLDITGSLNLVLCFLFFTNRAAAHTGQCRLSRRLLLSYLDITVQTHVQIVYSTSLVKIDPQNTEDTKQARKLTSTSPQLVPCL